MGNHAAKLHYMLDGPQWRYPRFRRILPSVYPIKPISVEIAPYPENVIPREIHHLWVFMEKDLTALA